MPRNKRNRPKKSAPSLSHPLRPARLPLPALFAIVTAALLAIYAPAIQGGLLWDDDAHITRTDLQSFAGLVGIWFKLGATQQYYPLLHSAFWIEHKLWGDHVVGYHLINIVWHALAVCLAYAILVRLEIPGAILAASLFAVHPVMVESVAWISEQKNTLSAVFYLSAMLTYLAFDKSRNRKQYALAFVLFMLGLLTKTVTATLPAALLVIFWWQRGQLSWKRDIVPLVPFFLLGAVAGVCTAWVERKLVGAEGADFELDFLQRCLLAGRVIWFYVSKLLWPNNLVFIYPRWHIDPGLWWQWLFPIGAFALLVWLWSIRKKTRAPLAGSLFFVGTLFPVLGFLNVYPFIYSFVADHFQYLASLGLITLAAAAVAQLPMRVSPLIARLIQAASVVVVGMLALLSWQQTHLYADSLTLYEATIDRNPDCWMAHNNLGRELENDGDIDGAIEHYRTSITLHPNSAAAHNNLCVLLLNQGKLQEALQECRAAVSIRSDEADYQNNLAHILTRLGDYAEARTHAEQAIRLRPTLVPAYYNFALALDGLGNRAAAIQSLQVAAQKKPDLALVQNKLGELLEQNGELEQALVHLQSAVNSEPTLLATYPNLVRVLAKLKRPDEARKIAQQGIQYANDANDANDADMRKQLRDWLVKLAPESDKPASPPASR